MEDLTQLEKMGRELKCPICLSLLNSAASLTCNHVFCKSCITKSMKSSTSCPVCKVPFQRREVRSAPHMDNLVNIYKSMEIACGLNIFSTQKDQEEQVQGNSGPTREDAKVTCQDKASNQKTSKRKRSRKTDEVSPNISGLITKKPSFPAKKRVQVPRHPLSETPAKPTDLEVQALNNIKNVKENRSEVPRQNMLCSDKGEPTLAPFFWLRDDEDREDSSQNSQQTDEDRLLYSTPPNIPTFSDIKDADDNKSPSKSSSTGGCCGRSNAADLFDSEMFEWTQRACSPGLVSSPINLQPEVNDEVHGIRGRKTETPPSHASKDEIPILEIERSLIPEQGTCIGDKGFARQSSRRQKGKTNQVGHDKFKRGKNSRGTTQEKHTKSNTESSKILRYSNKTTENFMPKGAIGKNNSSSDFETISQSTKSCTAPSASESKPENISHVSIETSNRSDDEILVELLPSSVVKLSCHGDLNRKTAGKSCITSPPCQAGRSLRLRKRKQNSTDLKEIVSAEKNMSNTNPHLSTRGKAATTEVVSEGNQVPRCKKSKRISLVGISEDNIVDDHQGADVDSSGKQIPPAEAVSNITEKEIQSTENAWTPKNASKFGKLGQVKGMALQKCRTITNQIECSFCHSSEDSKGSLEMVHYFDGKPVTANHDGGSKVIHSHKDCTEWAPNVYFEDDTAMNLEAELARSRRISCCCCGLKGAALGCYEKNCRKSFHVPCAKMVPQCRWDNENFVMLCPLHASSKLPNESLSCPDRKKKKCTPKAPASNEYSDDVRKQDNLGQCLNTFMMPKNVVLCVSALSAKEKDIVLEFKKLTGVKVMKKWDPSVTHVIASMDENGACKRTLKILMGTLEGKWILNVNWVKACMKAMKPVDEQQYEITVDVHGIKSGPQLGRLRIVKKQPKIFKGYKFYFVGEFTPSYKGYIKDLLVAGGGTILHRKPILALEGTTTLSSPTPSTLILYSCELPEKSDSNNKKDMILAERCSKAETVARSAGGKAVSSSWVLDSIAGSKLQS